MNTPDKIKILFVEDMPSDMELAIRELRKNNIDFTSKRVETKEDYLRELNEFRPDIVISDYAMPEFDGMAALKILLDFDSTIPLVVLTGSLNEDTAVDCLRAGASDYVIKEHITRLPYAVTEALEQRKNKKVKNAIELELKQRTEELNNYFNQSLELFCIIDLKGYFKRLNKTWETTLGYTLSELNGLHLIDLAHPDDIEATQIAIEGLLKNNIVLNLVNRYRCKDQQYKWIEWRASRVESMIYAAARDITERKLAEEELKQSNSKLEKTVLQLTETQKQVLFQEKMRSLGQMTSGICHDINNSLTPIMGYIDILKADENLSEQYSTIFNRIIKSTNDIAKTIGRLREFYRADVIESELKDLDINGIITETIELTKHRWKNIPELSGTVIKIKPDLQDNLPLTIGQESEIVEALTNLILNACDAMPKGGELRFKTYLKGKNIIIEISDTGIGMNEETLLRCLDPFFTTKGKNGTGLGLSMVFGILERHKGEIKINSVPDEGTMIELILPVRHNPKTLSTPVVSNLTPDLSGLKILSVEDDPVISEMLTLMLKRKGFEVVAVRNGRNGIDKYQEALIDNSPFDLVITDLGMAEMDGISFSKAIKIITPAVPIILLTGFGSLLDKTEHTSIDYLLNKPLLSSELMKAINTLVKTKNAC